ncbi:hypothetical protein HOK51_07595 [Candidatus Woesearchaeota archaeon]|jgi:hypothetical protein|nr:hypothetical protein [Candidatus Woesearchaeota archaeon]MBT6519687.1 hypothetical protein [Candidatus Woesearchaeota archaeon]MBT7367378.1 hypothetical protein [Candidatus Woesearchaeota archaeon]
MAKLNIKINRKKNSLDDLARQTAVDDKDLINDILNPKKKKHTKTNNQELKKIINSNNADSDIDSHPGFLIYLSRFQRSHSRARRLNPLCELNYVELKSRRQGNLFKQERELSNFVFIPDYGLVAIKKHKELVRLAGIDNLKDSASPEFETITNSTEGYTALEYIPKIGLVAARTDNVLEICLDKNKKPCSIETTDFAESINELKWVPKNGLYAITDNGQFINHIRDGHFDSVDECVSSQEMNPFINRQHHKVLEWVPDYGLICATEQYIFRVVNSLGKPDHEILFNSADRNLSALCHTTNQGICFAGTGFCEMPSVTNSHRLNIFPAERNVKQIIYSSKKDFDLIIGN